MIRRSLLKAGVAFSALAVTALATFAQAPPSLEAEKYLPAGKTIAFLSVTDLKTAESVFHGTDLGQVWKTLEAFRLELEKGLNVSLADAKKKFQEESGIAFDDAMQLVQGGMAAGLVDMAPPEAKEPGPVPVLAVSPRFKGAIEAFQKKNTPPAEAGQPARPPFQIVEKPGALFLVLDPGSLAEAGAKTLADDAGFRAVKAKVVGANGVPVIFVYGNADSVLGRVLRNDEKSKGELTKLGLQDVKGVGLGIGFADGRLREALVVTSAGPRTGIVKAVTAGKALDLAALAKTAPADCLSFWAGRFDAKLLFDEVTAAVKAIEPGAAEDINGMLAEFEKQMGMKLVEDVLAPMGDAFTVESFVPEDGFLPETVMALQLRDAAKFEAMILKLAHKAKLEVKTVSRGARQIKYLQAPMGKLGDDPSRNEEAMQIAIGLTNAVGSWVVEGGTLYTASLPQTLEDRFERMAKGTLGDSDQWKASLARAPQGARFFTWGKTRPIAGIGYHILLKVLRAFESPLRQAGIPIDTALLPRPNTFARPWLPSSMSLVVEDEAVAFVNQGGVPILSFMPALAIVGYQEQQKSKANAMRWQVEESLRQIYNAQQAYSMEKNQFASSIEELMNSGALQGFSPIPGYQFVIVSVDGQKFMIEARPSNPSYPYMIIDQSGYARGYGEPNPFEQPPMDEQPPTPPEGGEAPQDGAPQGEGGDGK